MGRFIDKTGNRYGRLVVIQRASNHSTGRSQWYCKCDCGKECKVTSDRLSRNVTQSCGCMHRELLGARNAIDLSGRTFGKLIVLEPAGTKLWGKTRKKSVCMWRCKCECGVICEVAAQALTSGNTNSCGQHYKGRVKPYEEKIRSAAEAQGIQAIARGIDWNLTTEQAIDLISKPCYYCNAEPRIKSEYKVPRNGIDRLDSFKSYTTENSVSCCSTCNFVKHVLNEQDFYNHILRIVEHKKLLPGVPE